MERISALIEKLRDQFASGADIDQLLLTAQLLEGELRYHRQKGTVLASPNVAVLMPNNGNRLSPKQEANPEHERFLPPREAQPVRETSSVKDITPLPQVAPAKEASPVWEPAAKETPPVRETAPVWEPAQAKETPPVREITPVWETPTAKETTPVQETAPAMQSNGNGVNGNGLNGNGVNGNGVNGNGYRASEWRGVEAFHGRREEPDVYNPIREVPTLTHQIPKESRKELNETMAGQSNTSLNDKLKTSQRELSAALTEAPIRDLRKAIGINDRYVFISELFRGDEIMYERSVKTINNFSIFQEAYYWMERELKLKLAWDQERTSTQLFYQLVRRRFS